MLASKDDTSPSDAANFLPKTPPWGLRDAHKSRTRRALRVAALKLFAAQGFDTTKAEEIAENAGVSVRTFFRYFPTKESVVFLGQRAWGEIFCKLYHEQPASLSDVDAMSVAARP